MAQPTQHKLTQSQILALKKILRKQGFYKGSLRGSWNDEVGVALKKFQRRNGIAESGVYDTATDQLLINTFQRMELMSKPIKGLDAKTRKFAEENYGYLMIYMRDPEIGPILVKAAKEGWDQARLEGKLRPTKWWTTHSSQERAWQNDIWQDPASVARRRAQQEATILDKTAQLGVQLMNKRFSKLVEDSLRFGWNETQIQDAIVAEVKFRGHWLGDQPGSMATDVHRLEAAATQYMIDLTDKEKFQFMQDLALGETRMEDITASFVTRAANQYGHLAEQIKGGMTMQDLFSEHRQAIARTLEIDEDQIDLTDPKWSGVLGMDDDGKTRAMTVGETRLMARQEPGFRRTAAYREEGSRAAMQVANIFGFEL